MSAPKAPETLTREKISLLLPPRPRNAHKGDNGYALLCVGSAQYTGAALLSAAAALRAGCGVLEVAVPSEVKPAFCALPEACCTAVNAVGVWDTDGMVYAAGRIPGKRALGLGCGMGKMEDTCLLKAAIGENVPLVIDADGLNLLAEHPDLLDSLHKNVILTPHPGEMARLMGTSTKDVLLDPAATAAWAAERWKCNILLKGADTYLSDGERVYHNATGNPGLAKGGSGDVLTGLIVGLLSQGLYPIDAACAGAYLLGTSAENALSLLGERMLMAGDVLGVVKMTLDTLK